MAPSKRRAKERARNVSESATNWTREVPNSFCFSLELFFRVQKRNTEIKTLRSENEKLSSLLRKCEERINQLFDVKEREQAEKQRANKLAEQLFEHKKMIGKLTRGRALVPGGASRI